jgi:hypothetical protein
MYSQMRWASYSALRTLARLWKASGDADLPAAVAAVLGVPAGEVEAMFAQVE